MDSSLKALAQRLERLGMVTAPFGDHLSVRLPLFCHVRVRIAGGRLRCVPYTGALPRTTGTWVLFVLLVVALSMMFKAGITASAMAYGFLAVLAGTYEAIRYALTESCITRVQAVVLAEPALLDATGEPTMPAASTPAALPAPGLDRVAARQAQASPVSRGE